ncbi:zinc ribbon domain-containing protein [Roseiflexus sp. RS-1]|jgi:phage shock protein PspC (stress-responsive transcriptional regulator)|uniref:zinc ribbon domain-containing protein n=1 Tax=Roseiflexus sp. (strain RS-1) TaxID=357808 RepID=UPI0000D81F84|nr:zinc ribbon domain-containing protein [Roseiflexus sp. RS-1]ABQ88916.1 hypothetical protein RoseRS_0492 [Roseiflexus sp. RS-1]
MPSSMRTCPYCDALQSPEARFCRSCGRLLPEESFARERFAPALAQPPSSQVSPEIRAYAQSFRQPSAGTSLTLGALAALCIVVGTGAAAMSGESACLFAPGMIGITFLFAALFFWVGGWNNRRRGAEFLQSDRVLVAWVYTPEEWQQVRQYFYERVRSDSPPYGCLPILFGGIGFLVGVMAGMTDSRDLVEAAVSVLVGTLTGAIAGGVLILPVYLINWFSIERMRRPSPPACVALGRNELFYERVYLDADRHPIDAIFLKQRPLPHLKVVRHQAGGRTERMSVTSLFPSIILIPPRMIPAVEQMIPQIIAYRQASDSDEESYD